MARTFAPLRSCRVREVLAAAGSLVFWGFIVASSVLLFSAAVLIWIVTRPFDPRT